MNKYDVAVIGAGSGGLTVAISLAGAGKKVALIERGLIGGDCTNVGCVPSKAFLDISRQVQNSKFKVQNDSCSGFQFALSETRMRRKIIQDEELPDVMMEKYGFEVIQGSAKFLDKKTLQVDGVPISADKIVIATGGHAALLDIDGVDPMDVYTNESFFEIQDDISKLVIIGGGYIGCELAEACANVGVNVVILQRNEHLIPREEHEASHLIETMLIKQGVQVHKNVSVQEGKKKGELKYLVVADESGMGVQEIEYDKILTTVGRRPNISGIGLEEVGIKYDSRGILVNKYNQTNLRYIFAIGDCVSGNPQFTHGANNEGRGVVRNILFPYIKSSFRGQPLPSTLYTTLEVARVGKTRQELFAQMTENDFRSVRFDFSGNDRARITNQEEGFVMIHAARLTGRIYGATIVAREAGEMLPILTSAMTNKVSLSRISKQIFAYPTRSEVIKKVADSFVIQSLTNLKSDLKWWLKSNILQISTATIWGVILVTFFSYKLANDLSTGDMAIVLYQFVRDHPFGPLVYIVSYALRPVVLFPATLLTLMSGVLFGPLWGFVYTMIGENLSANFAYLLGRVFGKKLLGKNAGFLSDLSHVLKHRSFGPILFTRLAFFPFDLVNYGAGILRARWFGFFLATFVGIIPGALVFIFAGASVSETDLTSFRDIEVDTVWLWIALGLFLISLMGAKFLKKKSRMAGDKVE